MARVCSRLMWNEDGHFPGGRGPEDWALAMSSEGMLHRVGKCGSRAVMGEGSEAGCKKVSKLGRYMRLIRCQLPCLKWG